MNCPQYQHCFIQEKPSVICIYFIAFFRHHFSWLRDHSFNQNTALPHLAGTHICLAVIASRIPYPVSLTPLTQAILASSPRVMRWMHQLAIRPQETASTGCCGNAQPVTLLGTLKKVMFEKEQQENFAMKFLILLSILERQILLQFGQHLQAQLSHTNLYITLMNL